MVDAQLTLNNSYSIRIKKNYFWYIIIYLDILFIQGSSAVDFLMDSKWATGKTKSTVEFTHRESVTIYLQR